MMMMTMTVTHDSASPPRPAAAEIELSERADGLHGPATRRWLVIQITALCRARMLASAASIVSRPIQMRRASG